MQRLALLAHPAQQVVALEEFVETAAILRLAKEDISVKVKYDEFNLDMTITYKGDLIKLYDERPEPECAISDSNYAAKLSGYLIKAYADRVLLATSDGVCSVKLHFIN